LLIYIENIRGRDPAYLIRAEDLRASTRGVPADCEIVEAFADAPDLAALSRARYFVGSKFDTARLRQHGANLAVIHSTSAGVEGYLPLDWLPAGAVLSNSSGVHAGKGGEFGLLALMMLNDRIPQHASSQRQHQWRRTLSTPIKGKTVLIYGVGALGGAIAEMAKRLSLIVWGVRRSGEPHPHVDRMVTPDALHAVLPEVDFLVLSCPLTEATRGLIGATELALLPPHAGVVNIARQAVMDYAALAEALTAGRLAGAVLDVFETEPLPADAPWWDVPNLMVIPHTSSDSPVGYIARALEIFADNVQRHVAGAPLVNVVDGALGY
jgi:phosphoglycerate dehydrogenase-like enzyme